MNNYINILIEKIQLYTILLNNGRVSDKRKEELQVKLSELHSELSRWDGPL